MFKFTKGFRNYLDEIASLTPTIEPFVDDSPAKKSKRIKRVSGEGWKAFKEFSQSYFPHIFRLSFCDDHEDMFNLIEQHTGLMAITGFRGYGKTVLMGVVYPIWKVIKGERYVVNVAADIDLAKERSEFMLSELTNNRRLLADFPDLEPDGTDEENFFLRNKTRIRARSVLQSIRGTVNPRTALRPGLVVCDDIDQDKNQGNQSIGHRKMDKIIQEIGGSLNPQGGGRIVWLGNLVHPNYAICQYQDKLIDEIKEDHQEFDPDDVKHIEAESGLLLRYPVEDENGNSVWEEQYPTASLPALRKKLGNVGYQREMLGKPVIEGNIFKHEWFKKHSNDNDPFTQVWLYSDPAWGEKGAYKAVITAGWDGNHFYIIDVWVRQTKSSSYFQYLYETFLHRSKQFGAIFRPSIETVFGQDRILADFDRWARDIGLTPISHHFRRINNKENKNKRIERLDTIIESGKLLFPDGQDTPKLISQFLTYPQGYIDGCDAVAGCLERFSEYDIGRNRVRVRTLRY